MSFTLNKSIRSKPVQREELGEAGERSIGSQHRQPARPALGRVVGAFGRGNYSKTHWRANTQTTLRTERHSFHSQVQVRPKVQERRRRGAFKAVCALRTSHVTTAPGTWRVSWPGRWCWEPGCSVRPRGPFTHTGRGHLGLSFPQPQGCNSSAFCL